MPSVSGCGLPARGVRHHGPRNGGGHRSAILFRATKWRSVKYEDVYLHAYRDGREARERPTAYFALYNRQRGHQSLDYRTPDEVYFGARADEFAAVA